MIMATAQPPTVMSSLSNRSQVHFIVVSCRLRASISPRLTAMHNLAAVVLLVAVAAVCQGKELEERQGLVPGVALAVAWVFALGS